MPRRVAQMSTVEILLLVVLLAGYALCALPNEVQAAPVAETSQLANSSIAKQDPQPVGVQEKWIDVSYYRNGDALHPSERWVERIVEQWRATGEGWRRAGNVLWNSDKGKWVLRLIRTVYGTGSRVVRGVVPVVSGKVIQSVIQRCMYDEDGNRICRSVPLP